MILDVLEKTDQYLKTNRYFELAFSFLQSTDLESLSPGRIDLEGHLVYAMVQEYRTKPFHEGVWEAHRRFIDIQYMVRGVERVGFANLNTMKLGDYVPERDFQPMTGKGQNLVLSAGSFMIFFSQDAHMPGLKWVSLKDVKKIVIKCSV
ncbi:MAG: YhcH/YjgK/YiaL family protein [Chloroflexi bacterium]|nr:YhcH/YjgK/YiaL family protein [Chloroflexota bacterium]